MWTFIVTPVVSLICTFLFSFLQVAIRGEELARKSMLTFKFDEKDNNANETEENFNDEKA
jgi:hypothetical protein